MGRSFGADGSSLLDIVRALRPSLSTERPVIAIVGGGGKTSVLFELASSLAYRNGDGGLRVALTTTTHIMDPRSESGRRFDELIVDSRLSVAPESILGTRKRGPGIVALASSLIEAEDRLLGLAPSSVGRLRSFFDAILVEADGSRGRPIKAPALHEPAMPESADCVIGVVGLDCLGRPMDDRIVHRPELFGPLAGCSPGEPIAPRHILALARSPDGLFKSAPPGATRILVLNKADLASGGGAGYTALLEAFSGKTPDGVSAVLLCSLRELWARVISRA